MRQESSNSIKKLLGKEFLQISNYKLGLFMKNMTRTYSLWIVSPPHFVYDFFLKKCFLCYTLLTEKMSLYDCLYFLEYWSTCVLKLFVNQVVTSLILKLTLFF